MRQREMSGQMGGCFQWPCQWPIELQWTCVLGDSFRQLALECICGLPRLIGTMMMMMITKMPFYVINVTVLSDAFLCVTLAHDEVCTALQAAGRRQGLLVANK
jgi:hypothetical protein